MTQPEASASALCKGYRTRRATGAMRTTARARSNERPKAPPEGGHGGNRDSPRRGRGWPGLQRRASDGAQTVVPKIRRSPTWAKSVIVNSERFVIIHQAIN